jgi:hypothetical protein
MITGRPHVAELMSPFNYRILAIRANYEHVKRALETQLMNPSLAKCLRDDKALRTTVVETILKRADGMYVTQTPAIRV